MRQGNSNNKQQQRMRGRGNGTGSVNRKGPNPLSRSYESTGPDVKIRGTALHIAEKYVQLARDAQSSGDRVLAESYLQHAEHYYRIIAAAQSQMQQPIAIVRSDIQGDEDEDDIDTAADVRGPGYIPPDAPQPFLDEESGEFEGRDRPRPERAERPERLERAERSERSERPERSDRLERTDRPVQERPQRERFNPDRQERPQGDRFAADRQGGPNGQRNFRNEPRGDFRNEPREPREPRPEGGRQEFRSERPDFRGDSRNNGRGDRPLRGDRPAYRPERLEGERGERPDRFDRPERSEPRVEAPRIEPRPAEPVEPVLEPRAIEIKVPEPQQVAELPAFITGIQPRVEASVEAAPAAVAPVKRPRGRPRKVPLVVAPDVPPTEE